METFDLPAAIEQVVREQMAAHHVPGVAVGVVHEGRFFAGAFGVTNLEHPLPVTTDTLFQIGSTSKTVTATALMTLVDEGKVHLDAPIRTCLPGFRLQSEADAAALTPAHLVTHRGGFPGDYFKDTGRGDDAMARYVAKLANSPQLTPAGAVFSYSNAGFYLLGHLVETVAGQPFEQVIEQRIFRPLGMDRSFYFAEQAITHRVAAGHVQTAEGVFVARPWHMPRSGNAGGGIVSSVLDQLRYAAFHLGDGNAPGGRILQPGQVAFMQQPLAEAGSMADAFGVSWMLKRIGGERFVFHGGATNGQLSAFELAPDRSYGCTVLTNADSGRGVRTAVAIACRAHFLGIQPAVLTPPSGLQIDLSQYEGHYEARLNHLDVRVADGVLWLHPSRPPRMQYSPEQTPLPEPPGRVAFFAPDRADCIDEPRLGETVEFLRDRSGAIEWLRWDGRIHRRTG